MKKVRSTSTIILVSFLCAFAACKKDGGFKHIENGLSPAEYIRESEKAVIPEAVAIPANLPGGNVRVATYYAVGFQKYKASPKVTNPAVLEWVFVAPDAELFNVDGKKVGTHGAGPFWRLSAQDSIVAQQFSPARTAPAADPHTIDWLLLKPKAGTNPTGVFDGVDYIQRIATKGGKPPVTPPLRATDSVSVKYEAVYRFSKVIP
jgi:hypothetical protein